MITRSEMARVALWAALLNVGMLSCVTADNLGQAIIPAIVTLWSGYKLQTLSTERGWKR